jgi:hypothetical protein
VVLRDVRCRDRAVQAGLDALRWHLSNEVRAGTPWKARDWMDVLTGLDLPAWTALLGLIDECPVLHAAIGALTGSGVRAVGPSAFTFIATNEDIASVHAFLRKLPGILGR